MIEYLILLGAVFLSWALYSALGWNAVWIVAPVLLLTLPSLYGLLFGSPYLPTDHPTVRRMIALAEIHPGDVVVDLGCGDGRLLREASTLSARAIGYEISVYLFILAKIYGKAEIHFKNFWTADLQNADVIFCYLGKKAMTRFEKEIWSQLKPGCRVVAQAFPLPNLTPTATDGHVFRYDKG